MMREGTARARAGHDPLAHTGTSTTLQARVVVVVLRSMLERQLARHAVIFAASLVTCVLDGEDRATELNTVAQHVARSTLQLIESEATEQ